MADNFKAIHTYSDPGLDKQRFSDYELSIRISTDGLSYCVLDSNTRKFLHLESFDLSEPGRKPYIPGDKEMLNVNKLLHLMEGDLKWLANSFQKIIIVVDQGMSTLIPDALFNENEKANIFDFNIAGGPHPEKDLRHDYLKSLNAYAIYHVPTSLSDLIQRFFPTASVFHHSTAIIQSLFLKNVNQENDKLLYVNTGKSRIDILRFKGKKLDYYNSFKYNTADDFMYYLIFVVEQLVLNPESIEVLMMGEVEKHSSLSDLVFKYVRNIRFANRNEDFRYSFVFDQLPGHYYFNLLNASLCE
jgi:hypothetical protein